MAENESPVSRDRMILAEAQARGPVSTVLSFFRLSGPGWLQSAITLGGGSLTSALFLGVLGGYQMLWLQWIAIVLGVIMLSAISYVTLSSHLRPFDAINQHVNPILGCGWLLATLMANIIWCMPQFSLCYDALEKGIIPAVTQAESGEGVILEDETAQGAIPESAVRTVANSTLQDPAAGASAASSTEPNDGTDDAPASETENSTARFHWSMEQGALAVGYGVKPIVIDDFWPKAICSVVFFVLAFSMVAMSAAGGWAAWWFDVLLKVIIGIIVLCFFGTVVYLTRENALPWNEIATGFIPNFSHWYYPSRELADLLQELPADAATFWHDKIVSQQKDVMISTVATAVGINMTFLLPYSLLARGWDRTFRGLARFDLIFGMLIPFVLVTSCVVITSAAAFHAKADDAFLAADAATVSQSPLSKSGDIRGLLAELYGEQLGADYSNLDENEQQTKISQLIAELPVAERRIAVSLAKRNSFELSQTLAPLFTAAAENEGEASDRSVLPGFTASQLSSLIFSLGALAMGFSTMIILMLINGYVFAELFQSPPGSRAFLAGAAIAGIAGACWPLIWQGESRLWLAISASTFGFLLLPIAYFAFWLLINNKQVLGDQRPEGARRVIWNVLLLVSLGTTLVAAAAALWHKLENDPTRGQLVLGAVCCFIVLAIVGFFAANRQRTTTEYDLE